MRSKKLMDYLVWSRAETAFEKRFALANRLYYHWPISVSWDQECKCYRVSDAFGSIRTPRVTRVKRYRYGLEARARKIYLEYLLDRISLSTGDLVVDCGANVGELSLYLGIAHGCDLICVEPDDEEFACLQENVKGLNAKVVGQALWCSVGELEFYKKNESGDSSLFEVHDYQSKIVVETTTLGQLLSSFGDRRIRLLKLEAEGAEPEILAGAGETLSRIDYIAADVGPERGLRQETTAASVINFLQKHGFRLVEISPKRLICLFENTREPHAA